MGDVHTIKARINHMIHIERERARCVMGDAEWREHDEWVTENIVASAKEWIVVQLKEGRL